MSENEIRYFSLEEAASLLPRVGPLLESLQEAHALMDDRYELVMNSVPTNGGGATHREFLDASARAADALKQLTDLGIIVRDPSSGLIDFPAERDGVEIYLCWRLGEETIEWWHPPEAGYAGRQPL
jgi:hypothetical protein